MARLKISNGFYNGDIWSDYLEIQRSKKDIYNIDDIKEIYTLEDIIEIYGFDKVENFIRKKKIERIRNVINK